MKHGFEIERANVIPSHLGARKNSRAFLELSEVQLYFLLHGVIIGGILLYQSLWLFSIKTTAYCYAYNEAQLTSRGETPGTLVYHYKAGEKMYRQTTTRDEIPLDQHYVGVHYLPWAPAVSRLNTHAGNWLGFELAWGFIFIVTTMIFFIPNETMPPNSYFYFTGRRPWIHMIVK